MEDVIELCIKGVDKLVDKYFHSVPNNISSHTYKPEGIRDRIHHSRHHRQHNQRSPSSSSSSKSERRDRPLSMSQDPYQNSLGGGSVGFPPPPSQYPYVPYSQNQPHLKSEYVPSPPPLAQPYFPPPPTAPQAVGRYAGRRYQDESSDDGDDDDDDGYYSNRKPRRPRALSRRWSSSYHEPRGQNDYGYNDRQLVWRSRRGSLQDRSGDRSKSRDGSAGQKHGFKDEIGHVFTKSPAGITGGVVGALVGGWVAKKAQVGSGREGKHHSNALITLLGAAAGGLAVNAVIDKFEDRKKERAGEEKWGSGDEEDDGRGRRDGVHGHGRRQRSRSSS